MPVVHSPGIYRPEDPRMRSPDARAQQELAVEGNEERERDALITSRKVTKFTDWKLQVGIEGFNV